MNGGPSSPTDADYANHRASNLEKELLALRQQMSDYNFNFHKTLRSACERTEASEAQLLAIRKGYAEDMRLAFKEGWDSLARIMRVPGPGYFDDKERSYAWSSSDARKKTDHA